MSTPFGGRLRLAALASMLALGCQAGRKPAEAPPTVLAYEKDPRLLISEVERIRGMPDRKPTRIIFDDERAFAEALKIKVEKDAIGPTDADSQAFALAFEFPPPTAKAGPSWGEVYDEQILGFYDEHTHAVHVRRAALGEKSELEVASVLAHELTHSLQTQHFPFPNMADEKDEDVRLAQNAVLEGDAMLVMVAYLAHKNRIPLNRALVRAAQAAADQEFARYSRARGGQEVLDRAPPLLRERLSFPYMAGLTFVGAMFRAGGFELVNKVYTKPPTTTEQVLHPEKYLAGEQGAAVEEPEPPKGYTRIAGGRVGELQIRTILGYCLTPARASAAAAGWGGDAYTVAAKEKDGALFWSTVWDDEVQAKEFEAALKDYVECTRARAGTSVMPLADFVQRKGSRVVLARGIGARESPKVLASLMDRIGKPARLEPPFGPIQIPPLRQASAYRLPYVSGGYYVNEQLGVTTQIPRGFAVDSSKPLSVTFSRGEPSAAALGIEVSDQIPSMETIDELHAAIARGFQSVLGDASLSYASGRDVFFGSLGRGVERTWRVAGSSAGLKAIVLPICSGTGAAVFWGVWVDPGGAQALDWWLGSIKTTGRGEPPICVELNP